MTNSDGVYVDNLRIDTGDCSGRAAPAACSCTPTWTRPCSRPRGGILREGLAFDRCNVAIVTNIGMGDHLGLGYISTVEDLAAVKRVIVQHVHPSGMAVLNAADPIVAEMAASCPGSITYFAEDRNHPIMARIAPRACAWSIATATASSRPRARRKPASRWPRSRSPATAPSSSRSRTRWPPSPRPGAEPGLEHRAPRLASFVNDAQTAPGRFNVFDYRGATVIADYGHNPDAILALVRAVDAMPAKRRSVVISGAGDRRDEDIRMQTEILGEAFDDVLLYQDQCQRGRADGEVVALLRQGLVNATRAKQVDEIYGEFLAIDTALARLQAGDLCLILVDQVEEALEHIAKRIREA